MMKDDELIAVGGSIGRATELFILQHDAGRSMSDGVEDLFYVEVPMAGFIKAGGSSSMTAELALSDSTSVCCTCALPSRIVTRESSELESESSSYVFPCGENVATAAGPSQRSTWACDSVGVRSSFHDGGADPSAVPLVRSPN